MWWQKIVTAWNAPQQVLHFIVVLIRIYRGSIIQNICHQDVQPKNSLEGTKDPKSSKKSWMYIYTVGRTQKESNILPTLSDTEYLNSFLYARPWKVVRANNLVGKLMNQNFNHEEFNSSYIWWKLGVMRFWIFCFPVCSLVSKLKLVWSMQNHTCCSPWLLNFGRTCINDTGTAV